MNRKMNHSAGFTLVELLVVIGIIALLISILLPTLSKARYAAQKIACASNIRQFGIMFQMYTNDFQGALPLSYFWGNQGQSSLLSTNNGLDSVNPNLPLRTWLGQSLMDAGYMENSKPFYCPLGQTDSWIADSASNPWPPKPWYWTHIGYGVRPLIDSWPDTWSVSGKTLLQINIWNGYWVDGRHYDGLPNLSKLKPHHALITDVVMPFDPNFADSAPGALPHTLDGVNAYFVDGSVQWIPYKVYKNSWNLGGTTGWCNLLSNWDGLSGVWYDIDQYHR